MLGRYSLTEQWLCRDIFKEIRHQGQSAFVIPESIQAEGFHSDPVGDVVMTGFGMTSSM
jgi:hypothetical protein